MPNHFMPISDISKSLNINPSILYGWAKADKVPTKKDPKGVTLMSMDAAKEQRKKHYTPRKKKVAKAVRRRRPATKQADQIGKLAAVLEVFWPQGIPVKQYENALLVTRALDAVTT